MARSSSTTIAHNSTTNNPATRLVVVGEYVKDAFYSVWVFGKFAFIFYFYYLKLYDNEPVSLCNLMDYNSPILCISMLHLPYHSPPLDSWETLN